ncbi:MAG: sodium:solute symporter family protein [Parachlamydiaceae bacterium]|nr:sodium:solute symporter family protein [Parachlamydiaceae bacterium]
MDLPIFVALLFVIQLLCLIAGSRVLKNLKTENDYFLAGKDVKFFPLLMTFIATQVGGGMILGASEEAYQYGWYVLLYPMGACLGFLLLAGGIGRKLAQFQVSTVAQLFEVIYKSVALKKVASLLSIVSLFMVLVAQVIASKKFMISIGVNQNELFILFWAVIIFYTVMGGLKAVVSIDIIQASFFLIVFVASFGYVLYTIETPLAHVMSPGINSDKFDFDASKLSGWLFMPLLFMVIEQDMAQRCFAAKSPRVVTKAALWSAIIIFLICVIPIFFGILGKSLNINIEEGASVFMTVTQAITSPAFAAFIGCAVLMAIISTAISLINAVSSNLTQDFTLSIFKGSSIQKSRWITTAIGMGAFLLSFSFNNVVDLLIVSYELSVYCLFIPVIIALFKPDGNRSSAALAILFGAIGFFLFRMYPVIIPKEIASVLLSGVGFGLGELWEWKKRRDNKAISIIE